MRSPRPRGRPRTSYRRASRRARYAICLTSANMGRNEMGAYSYDDPIVIPGLARRRRWLTALALVVLLTAAALAVRRMRTNLASLLPMAAPTSTPAPRAAPGPDISLPKQSTPDTLPPPPWPPL